MSQELNDEEKWNVIRLCQHKFDFKHFYPDIIYHMDYDLELQNLSGDSYIVPGWFDSNNILKLIYQTHPLLHKCEIVIDEPRNSQDFKASKARNQDFKNKILCLHDGPFGMIYYPDEEETANLSSSDIDEDVFSYFELF